MPGKETRKLAAVMYTDITGYTAMVQENEAAALAMVDLHRNILQQFTEEHDGEVIAYYGDGSLSTYPSAIDAVKCALDMQREYIQCKVPVRIGLHLGDIVFKDGTVFGEGVNLASEIEAEAIPGAILISAKLQEELTNHPEILTESLGFYYLKYDNAPVELFAIANEGLSIPSRKKQYGKLWKTISRTGILLTIIILVAYIMYDMGYLSGDAELKQERIAVRFTDLANVPGKDKLAVMTSLWISNRIEEIPGSKVVKPENATSDPSLQLATAGSAARNSFAKQTGAANLLEGQIFLEDDSLVFDAKIIDLDNGNVRQVFGPIKCSINNEMQGVNEITGEIRGWWASKDLKFLSVPVYDAFNAYLVARSVWLEDRDLAERKLREAISLDPKFIDPYFLLLGHLQNEDRYSERDTLLLQVENNFSDMNARQRNLFEVAKADASGDLRKMYYRFLDELNIDSLDFFNNTEGMVIAMHFVNNPQKAIQLFRMIPLDSVDLHNCGYCGTRIRTAISTYLALDSIKQALDIAELIVEPNSRDKYRKIQLFVASGDSTALRNLIVNSIENKDPSSFNFWSYAAWHYTLQGDDAASASALENAIKSATLQGSKNNEYSLAEANYLLGNYNKIEKSVDIWLDKYPTNRYILSYAARVRAHLENKSDIEQVIEALNNADKIDKYDYGYYTYYLGVIESILGNHDKAMGLLEKAYSQGYHFGNIYYDHDVDLMPLFEYPRFQRLMHPVSK